VPRNCLKFKAKLCFEIAITLARYQTQSSAALACLRLPVNRYTAIRDPEKKPVAKAPQSWGARRTPFSLAGCTQVEVPGLFATPAYQHKADLRRKYRQSLVSFVAWGFFKEFLF